MRLQVIDPSLNFACSSCTHCCDQPWRTLIEPEKVAALDAVDWVAEFPEMAGRALYRKVKGGGATQIELGKGEGTRCVFLDGDGLCRIHKKLGYDAKPAMCKQFPFFAARGWDADYVSANYGCRAIQRQKGPPATEQTADIAHTVPLNTLTPRRDAPFKLTKERLVSADAGRALRAQLGLIALGEIGLRGNLGRPSLNERIADLLATALAALRVPPENLGAAVERGDLLRAADLRDDGPFEKASVAPLNSRFLLAATMFPDTLPADTVANMSFGRRMTLVPRLLSLTQMRGVYASRLLGRNVRVDAVFGRPAEWRLTRDAVDLLGRYLRSRLWQQFPGGTRLPLLSAIHQHILDLNAVIFYAAAEAAESTEGGAARELGLAQIERALMLVEFHLANQKRLYEQVLKGWLKGALADPSVAWTSLRMLRCAPAAAARA